MLRLTFSASIFAGLAAAQPRFSRIPPGCTIPEPLGAAPVPGNGSIASYRDIGNSLALSSLFADEPSGYTEVFQGYYGSSEQVEDYLTYSLLKKYDPKHCAIQCEKEDDCVAFNLYFERSPAFRVNDECPHPPPTTNIVCALYRSFANIRVSDKLNETAVTNTRGTDGAKPAPYFERVIVGSNGYNRITTAKGISRVVSNSPDFEQVGDLGDAAIEAPEGDDTYLQYDVFPIDQTYNPELCAAGCKERPGCVFFNNYALNKNNRFDSTWCVYYSKQYSDNFAINKGYYNGTDHYTIEYSYSYVLE